MITGLVASCVLRMPASCLLFLCQDADSDVFPPCTFPAKSTTQRIVPLTVVASSAPGGQTGTTAPHPKGSPGARGAVPVPPPPVPQGRRFRNRQSHLPLQPLPQARHVPAAQRLFRYHPNEKP